MNSIETLISVLCDPEGKCCISGSDDDRRLIDSALAELAQAAQAESVQEDAAREPLQIFDSPRAKALMRAFEEGWAACRDAEFVGEDAQNDAFNQSATVNVCLAEDWTAAAERASHGQAQADSVQEDAARYRWLREQSSTLFVNISINGEGAEIAETLDSAVDAARKQGKNHD